MIDYFKEEYLLRAKSQKKKCLLIYLITAGAFLLFVVAMILWYKTMPYKSQQITLVKIIANVVTAIFVVFSFVYLSIIFRRVNKYYRLCFNLATGLQEETTAEFVDYDDNLLTKDGVDCKSMVFLEWNKYKKDYFERKVLVLYEKDFPEIPPKSTVKFITQGNVLIKYEIINEGEKDESDSNGNR